jgi:hypothetical protein
MRKILLGLFLAALTISGVVGCKSTSAGCSTCGQ